MPLTTAVPIGAREPIGDFESLMTAVTDAIDRDDFTRVQVGNLIALAESQFNRVLRIPQMEESAALTGVAGDTEFELPQRFLALRAISLRDSCCAGVPHETTPFAKSFSRAYFSISGRKLKLHRALQGAATFDILYYAAIPNVSENNTDNWLLNDYPDIYYYGALVQAEAFHANDERVPMWKAALEQALSELQAAGNRDRYGGGPLVPRTNIVQARGACL